MRVLIISHGHPTFSKGGGELAAYYLYQGINQTGEHEAWFVGRAPDELLHLGTPIAALNDREYLIAGNSDLQHMTATIPLGRESDFFFMLQQIRPDVIHFHHYVFLGVEMILAARRACPNAAIVLTLHEYLAICTNSGLMVKTDGRLCHHYSPRECHLCFPKTSPEEFFLREQYIKSFFRLVDRFVSPSEFLRSRYVEWGIDAARIALIENGLPEEGAQAVPSIYGRDMHTRFAYFGQINPYKGVDVILEAFVRLGKKTRKQVTLDIFGSALKNQTAEFQAKIENLVAECGGMVRLHGAYEPEEMPRLMSEVDWVVLGSVWWENSPMVIQEAFKFRRPVIAPDIGGMAEKARPGRGGLNYRARDSVSLANVIQRIVEEPELFNQLQESIPDYPRISDVTARHIHLYNEISRTVAA